MFMRYMLLSFFVLFNCSYSEAQNDTIPHSLDTIKIQEATIIGFYRADGNAPATFKNLDLKDLDQFSYGQEPSLLLSRTPSVNVYSDAGNFIGYSYFRMRGIDQTRVNMTLDGMPLNESEDQGVYFSNYPDFFSSVNSVQIQRGVGTSTNGTASYAGSLNFESPSLFGDTILEVSASYGSYNSYRAFAEYASGKRKNFGIYIRASHLHTDGFKDHSGNNSQSFFTNAGFFKNKHIFKLTMFAGNQRNQLAWIGSPLDSLKKNLHYNADSDEKDHFFQAFAKINYIYSINENSNISSCIYYNHLKGNYDFDLNNFLNLPHTNDMYNYAFAHQMVGGFINYSLRIHNLRIYAGANGNTFHRKHTGSERTLGNLYTNTGYKNDASMFTKLTYTLQKLTVFGDLQYRHTEFDYKGDVKFNKICWNFINPRIGLSYKITDHAEVYYSFGKTSREPTRNDIFRGEDNLLADSLGSPMIGVTRSEQVMNHELGYKLNRHSLHVNINCYYMKFANEIVLNGEYGPNGLPLHSNVAKSFRSGIEFDIDVPLTKNLGLSNNSNFSFNRIEEEHVTFQPVLTPNLIINQSVYFKLKSFYISLSGRYQKASYIDFANQYNIPEFYCLSSRISYTFGKITISLWLDNLTNKKIYNQGYIGPNGNPLYFVQAPINYFTSIKWNF